jgi:nucleoside phosphorylase/CheY-like chemotaxis protein
MISILIVDDTPHKISEIKKVIFEYPEISNNITVASDINNAKRLLEDKKFDLLILDLVLPDNFGDVETPENGIDFLKEICLDPNIKRPYHIIGLSAHPELIEKHENSFKQNLWYLIEYRENIEVWKEHLRNKIEYLINSKKDILNLNNDHYNFEVAIITALHSELDKILKIDASWIEKKIGQDSTSYYLGYFKKDNITIRVAAASAPQMGMSAASTLSMKMIKHFKPQYLIMSGIAAGIKGEVELGDILIADQVWDGACGKIKDIGENKTLFQPDPKSKILNEDIKEKLLSIKASKKYLNEIRSLYPGTPHKTALNLHIGPMASVPAVIQSNEEIEKIKSHSRKLIGIEMETYGVFYSAAHCENPKPIALSIKSVCDFANEEKNDNLQDYAAYTSAAFIHKLILNELDFNT